MAEKMPVFADGRSLGGEVKAARMRFGWLPEAGRYVRVSGTPNRWLIEARTPAEIRAHRTGANDNAEFYIWWESEICVDLLAEAISRSHGQRTFTVDDSGRSSIPWVAALGGEDG